MAEQLTNNKSVLCRYMDTLGVVHEGWFRLDELATFFADPLGTTDLNDVVVNVGKLGTDVTALQAMAPTVAEVNIATAATIDITHEEVNTAGKKIKIGKMEYKFVTALTQPAIANEIIVANNVSNQALFLKAAINGEAGAGETYGTGTTAHTQVTATAIADGKVTLSMKTKGTAGVVIEHDDLDAYDIASPAATWSTAVVGTPALATGQIIIDAINSKLYVCTDDSLCTAYESSGWKYTELT